MSADDGFRWRSPIVAGSVLLILLAAYVLSIGPAYRLVFDGYLDPSWLSRLYFPINWLCDKVGVLGALLQWYIDLWVEPWRA